LDDVTKLWSTGGLGTGIAARLLVVEGGDRLFFQVVGGYHGFNGNKPSAKHAAAIVPFSTVFSFALGHVIC
jgi:hypothetical protein